MSSAKRATGRLRWSQRTALDPKHRPQLPERPSTTVRREWARWPQEAHLLSDDRSRIRRLLQEEIAVLQGFDPAWFEVEDVSYGDRIRAAGNAVPPPLSKALMSALFDFVPAAARSHVELCAGGGGLALGAVEAAPSIDTLCLAEIWEPAVALLRSKGLWASEDVFAGDVRDLDLRRFRGVGLLSGGLPCQPWSNAGRRRGTTDERDLMSLAPAFIAAASPVAFVFENVPGIAAEQFAEYLAQLLARLRQPGDGGYGVAAGILQAANYGVPQARRRLVIVGVRNASNADATQVLDRAERAASHRTRAEWRAIASALPDWRSAGDWLEWPYRATAPDPPALVDD